MAEKTKSVEQVESEPRVGGREREFEFESKGGGRERERGREGCEYAVTTEGSGSEKFKYKHGRTILTRRGRQTYLYKRGTDRDMHQVYEHQCRGGKNGCTTDYVYGVLCCVLTGIVLYM